MRSPLALIATALLVVVALGAVAGWMLVSGRGGGGTSTPAEPAARPLQPRAGLNPTVIEVARLEDAKERADGRLAALLAGDADPAVRRAAAMALGHIHHPDDAPALLAAYGDADLSVAEAALFATGLLHEDKRKAPAAPLLPLLAHESPRIRSAAVEALGRIGDPATADAVHALIADDDPAVRGEAALAAWRLAAGAPKIPELGDDATDEDRAKHAAALATRTRIHAVVMPLSQAAAKEPDAEARWRMVMALQDLRRSPPRWGPTPPNLSDAETATLAALARKILADPDVRVRQLAALLAARALGAAAAPTIAPAFADPAWSVRVRAIDAARVAKSPDVLPTLRRLAASDPHHLVRRAAIELLATMKDPEAAPAIEQCLGDQSPTVRRAALAAWAELRGAAAVEQLRPFLSHTDPWTRSAAVEALGATVNEEAPAPHVDAVVALLRERFKSGDRQVQAAVLSAAEGLPVAAAADFARLGLAVDELEVRGSACELIKKRAEELKAAGDLMPALSAGWEASQGPGEYELRQGVLDALVALGDARAEPLLRAGLDDAYRAVREAARKGLEKLTGTAPPVTDRPDPRPPERPSAEEARSLDLPARLRIETSRGTMRLELFRDDAPLHVYSLVRLARRGFYDGLPFHRVENAFVIQGGCPRGTGWGDPGYTLSNEVNPRRYAHGVMGMPDAGLDTGGCQIFINHVPWPSLDGRYTVFGQVIEGLDVVDRIEVGDVILKVRDE